MKYRVTIKDIAQQLGMSTSTVSRALSDHSDVSDKTKKIVRDLADSLQYKPDPIAVGLRRNKTYVIGVIVPQIINRFFSKSICGIQDVAREHGFRVMITNSEESLDLEKENLSTMLNSRVDGLIVALSRQTSDVCHFDEVLDAEIPLVYFDRVDETHDVSRVIIDDYEVSYKAVKHLIEQGCKKIAYVAGPQNLVNSRKRLKGYKDALLDHQISFDNDWLVFSEYQTNRVKKITDHFLRVANRPDAIFAINDAFAVEMIFYLKQKGIRIPEDIAIVGFNNEVVSQFIDPPLTSVDSPAYELGKEAASLLLKHIDKEDYTPKCKVLKSQLIVRQSSDRGM